MLRPSTAPFGTAQRSEDYWGVNLNISFVSFTLLLPFRTFLVLFGATFASFFAMVIILRVGFVG
jgi:hypothetical protein